MNPMICRYGYHTDVICTLEIFLRIISYNVVCERACYGDNRTWGHDSVGCSTLIGVQ